MMFPMRRIRIVLLGFQILCSSCSTDFCDVITNIGYVKPVHFSICQQQFSAKCL